MRRGPRFHHIGFAVLVVLAGCGRSMVEFGTRAPWRQEAEASCLSSGAVKEGAGIIRVEPIDGPGVCGATHPLKVAALGDGPAYGFADELRPPGSIPGAAAAQTPRWPINEPRYAPPPAPRYSPPPAANYAPPSDVLAGPPISLEPPGIEQPAAPPSYQPRYAPPQTVTPLEAPRYAPARQPDYAPRAMPSNAMPPRADDIPDDAVLPDRNRAPQRQAYPPPPRELPRLGPARGPAVTGTVKTAVTPPATLACPIVSALDHWIIEAVQPAARRWFRQSVVEIKQISAYSCRGMVGTATAHISEHAFGNAIDIAAFVLADGRKITVQNGWNGSPEETGFLHDVQLAACERFTTVLAPGYNVYHYNHIHLDLMRRASGRHACKPFAISGEVAAARQAQKTKYARRGEPSVTGSVGPKSAKRPQAIAGEDGYFGDDDDDTVTGSISKMPAKAVGKAPQAVPGEDGDFDEE